MEQYLNESDSLLGPEESEVDIRHVVMNAQGKKRHRLCQILSAQGQSEFSVVSAARSDRFCVVRARQEEECQELSKVVKAMIERKINLMRSSGGSSKTDFSRNQRLGREGLRRRDETAGRKVDLGGHVEREEACGWCERYGRDSCCWKSWVSNHRTRGQSPFGRRERTSDK